MVNEEIVEIKKVLNLNKKEITDNIRKMVNEKQKSSMVSLKLRVS